MFGWEILPRRGMVCGQMGLAQIVSRKNNSKRWKTDLLLWFFKEPASGYRVCGLSWTSNTPCGQDKATSRIQHILLKPFLWFLSLVDSTFLNNLTLKMMVAYLNGNFVYAIKYYTRWKIKYQYAAKLVLKTRKYVGVFWIGIQTCEAYTLSTPSQ